MVTENCGLNIDESDFLKMKPKQQNLILFRNQIAMRQENNARLDIIEKKIDGYRFWYKLTTIVGSALTAGVTYLFALHIGK